MAIGDTVQDLQTIADNGSMSIRPSSTKQWAIHNLYIPDQRTVRLYWSDGTHDILVSEYSGSLLAFYFHVTNSMYLKVMNVSGTSLYLGYDGIETRT